MSCKQYVLLLCRLSGRDMTAHYHDDSRDGLARGTVVYRQCVCVPILHWDDWEMEAHVL